MTSGVDDQSPSRVGRRSHSSGVGSLSAASLVSGAAGYAVIALGTRAVGDALFAPVSVLWSFWALSVAAVSFPVQHWTIRSAEAHGEHTVWKQVPRLTALVAGLCGLIGLVCLAVGPRLFPSSAVPFSIMATLLPAGAFLVGLQRGVLTYRRRFRAVATMIAGENSIRALAALLVLFLGDSDATASVMLGWGILAGFGIAVVQPGALRPVAGDGASTVRASVRLLGGFAGANVAAQAVLTSAPVVLALLSAAEPVITQVFAILALLRVPYTGFVGASAAVTGPLARLVDAGETHRLRQWELRSAVAVTLLAAASFFVAPIVLPIVVRGLFATQVTIPAAAQGLLAAGGVVAVAGLLEMLVLLALGRSRRMVLSWIAGLLAAGACLLLPVQPVVRVSLAFLVAESVALAGLAIRRRSRTPAALP